MKTNKKSKSWYFLASILLIYISVFYINQEIFLLSTKFFYNILLKIIPIFALIFILMIIINYLVTPKILIKHLDKKGIKKWFIIVISGILSTGPIYIWYPLLKDLKDKGLSYGLISCFLYNRAIKIELIPLIIIYFSLQYIIILSIVMVFISIIQGILINKLMKIKLSHCRKRP